MNKPTPYIGNRPYIFISYSHRNSESIYGILEDLQRDGFRFWYDDGITPGVSWDDYIAEHIDNCGYFVAFTSAEYADSENCIQELKYAIESKKAILLIRLDRKKMTPGLEMRLCSFQSINQYETDDAEFLDRFETADGISVFQEKQENTNDRRSFKEDYAKLMKVLKQSYHREALFLEYEMIDNTLFRCIHGMGLVIAPTSFRIRDKVRPALNKVISLFSDDPSSKSLSICSPEQKLQIVETLFRYANCAEPSGLGSEYSVLICQLKSVNYGEVALLFSEIREWLKELKSTASVMLRKNAGTAAQKCAALAADGRKYVKALEDIYKQIRKGNLVRKSFGLDNKSKRH